MKIPDYLNTPAVHETEHSFPTEVAQSTPPSCGGLV